jgi:hypothetical protein
MLFNAGGNAARNYPYAIYKDIKLPQYVHFSSSLPLFHISYTGVDVLKDN